MLEAHIMALAPTTSGVAMRTRINQLNTGKGGGTVGKAAGGQGGPGAGTGICVNPDGPISAVSGGGRGGGSGLGGGKGLGPGDGSGVCIYPAGAVSSGSMSAATLATAITSTVAEPVADAQYLALGYGSGNGICINPAGPVGSGPHAGAGGGWQGGAGAGFGDGTGICVNPDGPAYLGQGLGGGRGNGGGNGVCINPDGPLGGGQGGNVAQGGDYETLLYGGQGNDWFRGGDKADEIRGGAGADTLEGGARNDLLQGGSGNDILDGGTGDDILVGGSGNDILIGGQGSDILYGGAGADIFVWQNGDNDGGYDVIKDFSLSAGDKLDIRALLNDSGSLEELFEQGGVSVTATGLTIAFDNTAQNIEVIMNCDPQYTAFYDSWANASVFAQDQMLDSLLQQVMLTSTTL